MGTVRVSHTLGGLVRDYRQTARQVKRDMNRVAGDNAKLGNRLAKANASEQHTMYGDEDIEYPPSFTVEKIGNADWVYGPDVAIGDGSQAAGYEFGSIHSPGHFDLARSIDVMRPELHLDAEDMIRDWPAFSQ